jgi:phosphoribosylaminoimidazolecarboxamide formyltransferase/IMP cyclohydrolase
MHDITFAPPQRALISVHDKTGLVALCRGLDALGISLIASEGTAEALTRVGIPVTTIQAWTGSPEVLDGRVKSLHPKLHAGILADRRRSHHMQELQAMQAEPIDLVICNLYPFAARWAAGERRATLIENIDIGGPTLLRAAAKNRDAGVLVLCDTADYDALLTALRQRAPVADKMRSELAAKAFRQVAEYDLAIASWCETPNSGTTAPALPEVLGGFIHCKNLRHGENPGQAAALYRVPGETGIAAADWMQGPTPSYTNILDLDTAARAVHGIGRAGCSIVKHTNLCGLAVREVQADALDAAFDGKTSVVGGATYGFNTPLQASTLQHLLTRKVKAVGIVAPNFASDALQLAQAVPDLALVQLGQNSTGPQLHAHRVGGGLLLQTGLHLQLDPNSWRCPTRLPLAATQSGDAAFALHAASLLKSDGVAIVHRTRIVGAAGGQVTRDDAVGLALHNAGSRSIGAVLASDGAFTTADCVQLAIEHGIAAIVQPGGTVADAECAAACDAYGVTMVLTGGRCFRH